MAKNAGDSKLEKSGAAEYIAFANIAQTGTARENEAVTASVARGEIEFAAVRASVAKNTK